MKDDDSDAPWFEYGKQIKNIVIQDGVTSLGAWAFVTCYQVEQVIIPKSVNKISAYTFILMFGGTSLKNVYGYTGSPAETFVKNYNDRVSDAKYAIKFRALDKKSVLIKAKAATSISIKKGKSKSSTVVILLM